MSLRSKKDATRARDLAVSAAWWAVAIFFVGLLLCLAAVYCRVQ